MNILFFDTETTGLVKDWDNPSNRDNPRIVQIGAILTNEKGRSLNTFSSIIRPVGFSIPQDVADISHGINNEMALLHGRDIRVVMSEFNYLYSRADIIVAHNLKFDNIVVKHELSRLPDCLPCSGKLSFCTMLESTSICCIPSKRGGYKWPRLSEAYKFFFDKELENAHDALTDVMACKDIYFAIKNLVVA